LRDCKAPAERRGDWDFRVLIFLRCLPFHSRDPDDCFFPPGVEVAPLFLFRRFLLELSFEWRNLWFRGFIFHGGVGYPPRARRTLHALQCFPLLILANRTGKRSPLPFFRSYCSYGQRRFFSRLSSTLPFVTNVHYEIFLVVGVPYKDSSLCFVPFVPAFPFTGGSPCCDAPALVDFDTLEPCSPGCGSIPPSP